MPLSKRIESGTLLLYSVLLITLGTMMTFFPAAFMSVVSLMLLLFFGGSFFINGVLLLSGRTRQTNRHTLTLLGALLGDLLCFLQVVIFRNKLFALLSVCFGVWTLFNGLVKTIQFVEYHKNKVPGRFVTGAAAATSLIVSLVFLSSPAMHRNTAVLLCGLYLIAYGTAFLAEFIRQAHPYGAKPGTRRFRPAWPAFLVALMPNTVIKKINSLYAKKQPPPLHAEKINAPPDLEVFVHASDEGFSKFGHVDLYFEGKVYTYGCYDNRTKWFFSLLGEGHLITTAKKQAYLKLAIAYDKKTIFGFGLRLTEEQKQMVREKLARFFTRLSPWYPDAQLAEEGRLPDYPYEDYASLLYRKTDALFYRVDKGRFKTYFVFGTNCVLWADHILGAAGLDLIRISGIITPGSYYEYLTRQYQMENTAVISYTVYRAEA